MKKKFGLVQKMKNGLDFLKEKMDYTLAATNIQTENVFDPLVDEDETEKTGW